MNETEALREALSALDEATGALRAAAELMRERLDAAMTAWGVAADAGLARIAVRGADTPATKEDAK